MRKFEVTARGFNGGGNTDDRVIWIGADKPGHVIEAITGTGATYCQELFDKFPGQFDTDFNLPGGRDELRTWLMQYNK